MWATVTHTHTRTHKNTHICDLSDIMWETSRFIPLKAGQVVRRMEGWEKVRTKWMEFSETSWHDISWTVQNVGFFVSYNDCLMDWNFGLRPWNSVDVLIGRVYRAVTLHPEKKKLWYFYIFFTFYAKNKTENSIYSERSCELLSCWCSDFIVVFMHWKCFVILTNFSKT